MISFYQDLRKIGFLHIAKTYLKTSGLCWWLDASRSWSCLRRYPCFSVLMLVCVVLVLSQFLCLMDKWCCFSVCSARCGSIPQRCSPVEATGCWRCYHSQWTLWNFGSNVLVSCAWLLCAIWLSFAAILLDKKGEMHLNPVYLDFYSFV